MVSIRLALTFTLVSFLCAAPANNLIVKAKDVVSQNGSDNNIVIKKNVLDVKEDDETIVEEEEPVIHHEIILDDMPHRIIEDEIHDNFDIINDEVIEHNTVVEETKVVEEVKAPEPPHDGPFVKIPFAFDI
jgi:hypothetical protein